MSHDIRLRSGLDVFTAMGCCAVYSFGYIPPFSEEHTASIFKVKCGELGS
jgi:hypothetical protein